MKYLSFLILLIATSCFGWGSNAPSMFTQGTTPEPPPEPPPDGICAGATTDYIGHLTGASSGALVTGRAYAALYTPVCQSPCAYGDIALAHIWHNTTAADNVKVCIYNDSGTAGVPESSDTLVGCTNQLTSSLAEYAAGVIAGAVSCTNNYWLVILTTSTGWDATYDTRAGSEYLNVAANYATPASTLSGSWSADNRTYRAYVEIE